MLDLRLKDKMVEDTGKQFPRKREDIFADDEARILERVYMKSFTKEDLIKRIFFDISQADFDKKEFDSVIKILQEIRDI